MGITNKDVLKTVLKVPQLEEQLDNITKYQMNLYELGCLPNITDCTEILNSALAKGIKILIPSGEWIIQGKVNLNNAPFMSYNIEGVGENSILKMVGTNAVLYDTYRKADSQQYRTKTIRNITIKGDLTNTGFDYRGLQLLCENLKLDSLNIGLNIEDGGYLSSFVNTYIVNCNNGVRFGNLATTVRFEQLHCRLNHAKVGACVLFDGTGIEDIVINGCLQGNYSTGLEFRNFSGNCELELYFELNGELATNTPSIKNVNNTGYITYKNCKIPKNISGGWTSGIYEFGGNVTFENCRLTGQCDFTKIMSLECKGVKTHEITLNKLGLYSGLNEFITLGTGNLIEVTPIIKSVFNRFANIHTNPFADTSLNVLGTGNNKPTITHDTTTTLVGKNTTKIEFNDTLGGLGNNDVLLLGNSNSITLLPNEVIVCTFIAKSNIDSEFKVHFAGGVQPIFKTVNLNSTTKKIILIGQNVGAETKTCIPHFYSIDNKSPIVNITAICINKGLFLSDKAGINSLIQDGFMY